MLAAPEDPLRLSPLLRAPSGEVLEAVRKLGLEGVVGKRIGSIYEPGKRSGAWIKLRTNREQEFVIGGYIPGAHGFDALLVGVYRRILDFPLSMGPIEVAKMLKAEGWYDQKTTIYYIEFRVRLREKGQPRNVRAADHNLPSLEPLNHLYPSQDH